MRAPLLAVLLVAVSLACSSGSAGDDDNDDDAGTGGSEQGSGGSGGRESGGKGGKTGAGGSGNSSASGGSGSHLGGATGDAGSATDPDPSTDAGGAENAGGSSNPSEAGSGGDSGGSSVEPIGDGNLIELFEGVAGMTIARDGAGALHVAASARVSGTYRVVYARCATRCDRADAWTAVPLALESTTSHVPTIGVTAAGLPRIYAASDDGSSQGFHYLSCDDDCEQPESWQDLRVSSTYPLPEPVALPRLPFAVSADGAAVFVTSDNSTLTAAYCSESCGNGASWSQVTLGGAYTFPESVAFGPAGSVQISGRHQSNAGESLFWLSCAENCGDGASWSGLDGLLSVPEHVESAVAMTAGGGTRIAAYLDDPTTTEVDHQFALLFCDTACLDADSWSLLWPLPIPAESANIGLALALDAEDRPTVGYVSDLASGYARCSDDCTSTGGKWDVVEGITVDGLNQSVPPTVPASCVSASWLMYTGPAFALDGNGAALLGITARAKALGGECGSGSMATTTGSFLAFPR